MSDLLRTDPSVQSRRAALRLPETLEDQGLLVGWSLEQQAPRRPIGFTYGDPTKTPSTGYIDPILLADEGHLITIAPTGAGKGVGCIVPALLRHRGPLIVIDPQGENAAITARRRRELGQAVHVLDPMRITELAGATLNPFDLIAADSPVAIDEATALAASLFSGATDGRDRFWQTRVTSLIAALILHLLVDLPPEHRHPGALRQLMTDGAGNPERLAQGLLASRHPEVRQTLLSQGVAPKEALAAMLTTGLELLDFLRNPLLQEVTAASSLRFEDVTRGAPMAIFLVLPPHMLESHGRLLKLWVTTFLCAIMRRRAAPPLPTLCVLDEAAQLGTLPPLRQAITLLRGYGLQTWSFWQDATQLQMHYPLDWRTMVNNCRVVQCFGALNMSAAMDMATLTGFGDAQRIIDLTADEMVLQLAGDEAVLARVPSYLTDPPFAGQFDSSPYYDRARDIMPKPLAAIRFYERAPRAPGADESSTADPSDASPAFDPKTPDPLLAALLAKWASAPSNGTAGAASSPA